MDWLYFFFTFAVCLCARFGWSGCTLHFCVPERKRGRGREQRQVSKRRGKTMRDEARRGEAEEGMKEKKWSRRGCRVVHTCQGQQQQQQQQSVPTEQARQGQGQIRTREKAREKREIDR
ncbi:MAG: hypothetical protein J3R72DRAFT_442378 [Linnemannia gamsii]|nr:MAG: hypothetical protein J3R72DRAFT_442378 [Linnemannia gamsii]